MPPEAVATGRFRRWWGPDGAAAGLILMSAVLGLASLDSYHPWGGDFAQYLAQTQAMLEGRQAQVAEDLRFITEESGPVIGPRWYPPGFPLLLLPVFALAGPDLWLLKLPGWLCWLLTLWQMYRWLGRLELGPWGPVAGLALLAWNSVFLGFLNLILSDIPFLLLVVVSLRRMGEGGEKELGPGAYLLTGFLMGLACWLRTAGMVLGGAWLLTLLLQPGPRRRWLVLLAMAGMWGLQRAISPDGGTAYLGYLREISLESLLAQVRAYGQVPALFMGWPLALLAYAGLAGILGWGMRRVHRSWPVLSWFGLGYAAMLLLWPFYDGLRFVFPLVPLGLIWGLVGWADLMRRWPAWRWGPVWLGALLLLGKSGHDLWEQHRYPPERQVGQAGAEALFAHIRTATPPETVVYGSAPRVVYFFTGRKGLHLPPPAPASGAVCYLAFPEDPAPVDWTLTYDQGGFRLYEPPRESTNPAEAHP